jgi:CheY-like chemotaxis protein
MQDGRLLAQSGGLGKGSEFTVKLPVIAGASGREAKTALEPGRRTGRSLRVLVVEDNADAADSLSMLLRLYGHDVQVARTGPTAVEIASAFRPDVVLLDIGLPKLNGHEAAQHIRGEPWGRRMVLIALTGWGQDEDRRRSKDAGLDHHMVKPVEPAALMQLLAGLQLSLA